MMRYLFIYLFANYMRYRNSMLCEFADDTWSLNTPPPHTHLFSPFLNLPSSDFITVDYSNWNVLILFCPSSFCVSTQMLTLILPRSRTGTVLFYTSTSNKRAARPKLYTKSLTRDLKLMYSRFTLVRISIKL